MDFENQKMLEVMFNDKQTFALLRRELTADATVLATIERSGLNHEFALDLLSQMVLHKRANVPTMIGLMKGHFSSLQETANALEAAAHADLVDFDPTTEQFILVFDVDADTQQLLRQYQYLPPMIVPPLEVTSNRGSGYITVTHDSLLLKDNHHDGDLCLDSINRFNRIPLRANLDVVRKIRNSWKSIDKPKTDETFEDYQKRLKAFERYEKDSFFTIALMAEMGNRFHLTHKVDKRGRTYAQGYHITTQGNCWNKAVVELAEPEYVL
ncbi:hypothetical protein [Dyella sp. ASV21]|uniref:hypothetical protein n=1 Tax=Dyella sp. ASV21 TaxID=2795114 RepID=UPI0018EE2109|nr:hypothetical protein [Dyella sp. ASV21]